MRLRCLAGAYAGQLRNYSTPVGLAALRSGMAARISDVVPAGSDEGSLATATAAEAVKPDHATKRRRGQEQRI